MSLIASRARRLSTPSRVLSAFAVVLLLLFAGAFAAGRLVGPLSPGEFPGTGRHGSGVMPGMPGMSGAAAVSGTSAVQPHGSRSVNSAAGGQR